MTIETIILAAVITAAIWTVRSHWRLIAGVWHEARWYERVALLACLAPIPGPVDEIAGLLVIRRVMARRRR